MSSQALCDPLLYRRRSLAFFSARTTQQVESLSVAHEVRRAIVALGGLAAWGAFFLLVAG